MHFQPNHPTHPIWKAVAKPSQRKSALATQPTRHSSRLTSKPATETTIAARTLTAVQRWSTPAGLRRRCQSTGVGTQLQPADSRLEDRVAGFSKHPQGWTHNGYGQQHAAAVVQFCEKQW